MIIELGEGFGGVFGGKRGILRLNLNVSLPLRSSSLQNFVPTRGRDYVWELRRTCFRHDIYWWERRRTEFCEAPKRSEAEYAFFRKHLI